MRIVDGLEADARAVGEGVDVCGAVPDGVDIGERRAAQLVDLDAVAADGAGGRERLNRRSYADADDDEVGRQHPTASNANADCRAVRLFDAFDDGGRLHVYAVRTMLSFIEPRD